MSQFGATTTAEEVIHKLNVSLVGKNALVTGASSGIGVETARCLALAGANVWLTGRDIPKTQSVADGIEKEIGNAGRTHVVHLDLSSLTSVKVLVEDFLKLNIPLHILINNAGVMAIQERSETTDGLEMQIGTNHFGHFALTQGLLPALKAGAPSRVIIVSSGAHRRAGMKWDDIMAKKSYEPWEAYGQSKTANILHGVEFNRRYSKDGITATALHPGVIETELWRHAGKIIQMNKTIPQGAATTVFCAVTPTLKGGAYYDNCQEGGANEYATNLDNAAKLWEISEEITKANKA